MRRALVLLWIGLVLPFALTFLNGGPDGRLPHVFFHPAYIAFLAVGLVGVRKVWQATNARAVKALAAAAGVAAILAIVGHSGEFIAVLRAGGLDANETVFEAPLHQSSAAVTVPMVMLAILLVLATTVTAALASRGKPVGPTVSRWIRNTHRWTSLVFLASLVLLAFVSDSFATVLAITAFVLLALTGLQMSGRHYLTKLRRGRRRAARSQAQPVELAPLAEEKRRTTVRVR